ncbi:MAG TPA: cbb3-type cytochrome oxidase assembly protein CcoS [Paenalcaligenes sp.]|nr:cbb3-type cytochrome oxidase assembly protein CcoS [Paenalcaligenes sp.]
MFESLLLLLPISILFVLVIGVVLWWAIFSGQFEDLDSAGKSILRDDDSVDAQEDTQNSERPNTTDEAKNSEVKKH